MKKELVAVKPRDTWDIILNVTLSEGKNMTDINQVIETIRANYTYLKDSDFIVEDIMMFAFVESMDPVNPGTSCKTE